MRVVPLQRVAADGCKNKSKLVRHHPPGRYSHTDVLCRSVPLVCGETIVGAALPRDDGWRRGRAPQIARLFVRYSGHHGAIGKGGNQVESIVRKKEAFHCIFR